MTDRIQWRSLSENERKAFEWIVGLIVNEDFDHVHERMVAKFSDETLEALVTKGLLVDVEGPPVGGSYALGPEGKRLAMLHKLAPQFDWETQ